MPGVTRSPQVRARRKNTTPQSSPTQHVKASGKDASAGMKSKVPSDFRQLSDMLDGESSEEEELYTDSLTSHTTASDSTTIGNVSFPLGPTSSRVEDPSTVSQTESQFSSNMLIMKRVLHLKILVLVIILVLRIAYLLISPMIPHQVKQPLLLP